MGAVVALTGFAQTNESWDGRFGPPGISSTVTAIATCGDEVYVGGAFTVAGAMISASNMLEEIGRRGLQTGPA